LNKNPSKESFYRGRRLFDNMAKVQSGLFLIGIGLGMVINSVVPLPAELGFVKQIAWLVFIVAGTYLIIISTG